MSYDTTIDLNVGGDLDLDGGEGADFKPVLEALRASIPEPDRWYDLRWYCGLLLGELKLCSNYESVVEPVLIRLSLQFPKAIFWVRGLGEDLEDVWLREYHDGRAIVRPLVRRGRKL